jgi:phage shock protein A
MEMKNMTELKLRKLFRGYVFTDFDGNEIGCQDTEHAMEEIKKLLKPDEKSEEPIVEKSADVYVKKVRNSTVELQRKIFELAKEQISLKGKVNSAQIARDLDVNASNVSVHLKKMRDELEVMTKKWQDKRDESMIHTETGTSNDENKSTEQ